MDSTIEKSNIKENTEAIVRCSIACTRSGLIALILSFLALSLTPSLDKQKQLDALGDYFTFRVNLFHNLRELPKERCWKALVNSSTGRDALLWPLQKLEDIYCSDAKEHVGYEIIPGPHEKSEPGSQIFTWDLAQGPLRPGDPPLAPAHLRILYSLGPAREIINQINSLGDPQMLTLARSFSSEWQFAIFKWEALRWRLIRDGGFQINYGSGESIETIHDMGQLTLRWLTLTSLQELAVTELPEISKFDALREGLGSFQIGIPWIPTGTRPGSVALGIQSGQALCTIYFLLYFTEATMILGFPSSGTLFGVFARTSISRWVFLAFVALPPISSTLLTIKTPGNRLLDSALSILILAFASLIAWRARDNMSNSLK